MAITQPPTPVGEHELRPRSRVLTLFTEVQPMGSVVLRDPAPVILVVEDDHDSRVMMRSLLEEEGYVVHSAADGRVAADLLASGQVKPALVIVDLNMPVMDGWELMSYLRAHPELGTVPVGVHSGDRDSTLPDGVSFVLHKPIKLDALLALVKHHCG